MKLFGLMSKYKLATAALTVVALGSSVAVYAINSSTLDTEFKQQKNTVVAEKSKKKEPAKEEESVEPAPVEEVAVAEPAPVEVQAAAQEPAPAPTPVIPSSQEYGRMYLDLSAAHNQECFNQILSTYPERFTEDVRESNIKSLRFFGNMCDSGISLGRGAPQNRIGVDGHFFDTDIASQYR